MNGTSYILLSACCLLLSLGNLWLWLKVTKLEKIQLEAAQCIDKLDKALCETVHVMNQAFAAIERRL